MIRKIRELLSKKELTGRVRLPMNGLSSTVSYYESYKGGNIPVMLVVLYNVEQLASEIAQRLKDSTKNSSEGNNDSE